MPHSTEQKLEPEPSVSSAPILSDEEKVYQACIIKRGDNPQVRCEDWSIATKFVDEDKCSPHQDACLNVGNNLPTGTGRGTQGYAYDQCIKKFPECKVLPAWLSKQACVQEEQQKLVDSCHTWAHHCTEYVYGIMPNPKVKKRWIDVSQSYIKNNGCNNLILK